MSASRVFGFMPMRLRVEPEPAMTAEQRGDGGDVGVVLLRQAVEYEKPPQQPGSKTRYEKPELRITFADADPGP